MNAATVPWIILFTPLVAAAVILFFGRYSKPFSAGLAIGATLLCGILSWWLFTQPDATEPNQFFWINLPDIFSVPIGVTVDHLINEGIAIIGTPDTVRKKLVEAHRLIGFQNFLALLQFGTLPRDLTEQNIRRFCTEVAPTLQGLTDKEYVGMEMRAAE